MSALSIDLFPPELRGSPFPGADHSPVPPSTPVFDAFAYLSFLAGHTERIRLGTNVYLLGLRHPFVAARAIQTLDIVSNGRSEVGIGAGWLREEYEGLGVPFDGRGKRMDEQIPIIQRLLAGKIVEGDGEYYSFPRACRSRV